MYWVEQQPASIPAVYSTLGEDLYVILTAIEPDGSATLKVYRNPLVNWIWIGGLTFVFGTSLVMWPHRGARPDRRRMRRAPRVPRLALAGCRLRARGAAAAQSPPPDVPPGPGAHRGRRAARRDRRAGGGRRGRALRAHRRGRAGAAARDERRRRALRLRGRRDDPALGWLVGARFRGRGVPGRARAFARRRDASREIEVRVDEPTSDPRAVRVSEHRLRLVREPGGLRVIETLTAPERRHAPTTCRPSARRARARPLEPRCRRAPRLRDAARRGARRPGAKTGARCAGTGRSARRAGAVVELRAGARAAAPARGRLERYAFAPNVPAQTERLALLLADPDATLEAPASSGPRTSRQTAAACGAGRSPRRARARCRSASRSRRRASTPGAVSLAEVRAVLALDDAALDVTETHVLTVAGDAHVLGTTARAAAPHPAARGRGEASASAATPRGSSWARIRREASRCSAPWRPARRASRSRYQLPADERARRASRARSRRAKPAALGLRRRHRPPRAAHRAPPPAPAAAHRRPHLPPPRGVRGRAGRERRARAGPAAAALARRATSSRSAS